MESTMRHLVRRLFDAATVGEPLDHLRLTRQEWLLLKMDADFQRHVVVHDLTRDRASFMGVPIIVGNSP